jgi:hypothetical protein
MTTELSDNDRALLAREVAVDQHGYRNYGLQAFTDGWDAAIEYIEKQRRDEVMKRAEWEAGGED